jgi:exopolysaccharide biosynthesis polyprenyl glycosylphosphotransferase
MPVKTARLYTIALIIADACAVLLAFTISYILRVQLDARPLVNQITALDFLGTFLALLPFWIVIFWTLGLYSSRIYQRRLKEYGTLAVASFIGILIVIGYSFVIDQPVFPARLVAAYAGLLVFILLVFFREILRTIRDILYIYNVGVQHVLIIGNNHATADIAQNLAVTQRSGFRVVAIAGKAPEGTQAKVFTTISSALGSIDGLGVTTIIQTSLYDDPEENQRIMNAAMERHLQYSFIPGESEFYSGKNQTDIFLGYPMISVYQTPLVGWGEVVKRIFDMTMIIVSSPVWVPFMLLMMALQKIFNPGPIFYKSKRLGLHGKTIYTYKFRSMMQKYSGEKAEDIFAKMGRDDLVSEYIAHRKVKHDPRITWFGNILRVTSIDELPQIFNVILGEMSLVGPRPIIKEERTYYKHRAPLLFSVRPGITGLWQVSGRSDLSFNERVELELFYAQNWSFWLDIKILFKTIGAVVARRGAE